MSFAGFLSCVKLPPYPTFLLDANRHISTERLLLWIQTAKSLDNANQLSLFTVVGYSALQTQEPCCTCSLSGEDCLKPHCSIVFSPFVPTNGFSNITRQINHSTTHLLGRNIHEESFYTSAVNRMFERNGVRAVERDILNWINHNPGRDG
jgi:hypothetical protein